MRLSELKKHYILALSLQSSKLKGFYHGLTADLVQDAVGLYKHYHGTSGPELNLYLRILYIKIYHLHVVYKLFNIQQKKNLQGNASNQNIVRMKVIYFKQGFNKHIW